MIAAHARLDNTHAIVNLGARNDFQENVAGVIVARLKSSPTCLGRFIRSQP